MRFRRLHAWDVTTAEARDLQTKLAAQVDAQSPIGRYETIAAADVSYRRGDADLHAAVVVVRAQSFEVLEQVAVSAPVRFPYVPGLLSFREAPAVLEAFSRLKTTPDVVFCDGQGIAHPRRFGLASHIGVWLNLPTIGCAKSRLCGTFEEPGYERGSSSPLIDAQQVVGSVLRTRDGVRPLFISVGHKCDLESAVRVVLGCGLRTRLPQPARLAHQAVNALRLSAH